MMRPLLFVLILAGVCLSFKLAITNPTVEVEWLSKKTVWVYWKSAEGPPPTFDRIDIDLMMGDGEGTVIKNISFGVYWKEPGARWIVAKDLPTRDDYYIRITSPQDKSFKVKSQRFKISGGSIKKQSSGSMPCASTSSCTAMAILMAMAQLLFW